MSPLSPAAVRVAAHAKVNLFLRVLAREASGWHQIETAFALLELADELEARRIDAGVTLEVDRPDLGPVEENVAVRAARAVLDATGGRFGVALRLTKRIPVRSGLGGGSSDAAGALHAVNALTGNAVPRHELLHFAARLGADVPFFASGAA
ncbi:MAG: 4-(cytidine 5'-diphospho)-2-C-methyl-D-erythritol kinase, partial [Gemmatimonadales bacterium]